MRKPSNGPDLGAISATIGLFAGLATGWLYMTGWIYAYWYFSKFQLGLLALDINREAFLIYGFWVVIEKWLWLMAFLITGLAISVWRPWRRISLSNTFWAWIGLTAIMTIFVLGYYGGRSTSEAHFADDQMSGYKAARRVEIIADNSWLEQQGTKDLAKSLAGRCFRLLLKNKGDLFLIRPIKNFEMTKQPVLVIPQSEVRAMRILADSDSCS